ncbi:MAG: hypothetical protein H8D55_02695 [Deltaproteobacteria bacterium]|nr:hypothetical protein [Deltaproteobacteria bacterium]
MREKVNKNTKVIPIDHENIVNEVVSNIIGDNKKDKRTKFFMYWFLGVNQKTAAKLAGYQPNYGYALTQKYRHSSKLRATLDKITSKMPERYRTLCRLRLAEISDIEGAALAKFKDDPELAIRKPQLLKQLKQSAGVLEADFAPSQNINIEEARFFMRSIGGDGIPDSTTGQGIIDVTPSAEAEE